MTIERPRLTTKSFRFKAIVATQFLTTFNDNAFRMALILIAFSSASPSGVT